jgi:hypothetical protein
MAVLTSTLSWKVGGGKLESENRRQRRHTGSGGRRLVARASGAETVERLQNKAISERTPRLYRVAVPCGAEQVDGHGSCAR